MARGRRERTDKRRGAVLGWVLIALLLAALAAGGFAVYRAAAYWRNKVIQNAAALTVPAAVIQPAPAPAQEPPRAETLGALTPEPQPEPEPEPARVTLMAVGDDLIHNCVYWSAETPEGGYDFTPFFDDIRPIVQQYDLACINQETILVQDRSLIASYPIFGSPIEVADALADAGFNVVTFAGNHCFDKKETGVTDTLRYFHETYPDITTLGIHDSEADAAVIPIVEKNGIRIAMLNFTYGLNNSMPEKRWMVDMLSSTDTVCGRIAQAKQEADFVIVFPHWGTEDELSPDESQLRWAQEMADAGADLIIGGHPHTLQPTGLLTAADGRDVPVYYSLGNFLSHQKEMINLLGGMASVTIVKDKDGTRVEEYELKPTINVILRDPASGWYDYRPMLLEDYTPELAAQNRFTDCTVEAMQTLYEDIVG